MSRWSDIDSCLRLLVQPHLHHRHRWEINNEIVKVKSNRLHRRLPESPASSKVHSDIAKITDTEYKDSTYPNQNVNVYEEIRRLCIKFGTHKNMCHPIMLLQNHQLWTRWSGHNHLQLNTIYLAFNKLVIAEINKTPVTGRNGFILTFSLAI